MSNILFLISYKCMYKNTWAMLVATAIIATAATWFVSALSEDWLFWDYFSRIVWPCPAWQVLIGFNNSPELFGTKLCTPLINLVKNIVPTCTARQVLQFDGNAFTCWNIAGIIQWGSWTTWTGIVATATCGTAHRKTYTTPPLWNILCASWNTPSAVRNDGTSAFAWSCTGSDATQITCFAYNGNGYINLGNGNGIAACNQQIFNNYWSQKYSCTIGGGCWLNWLPPSSTNPSANPQTAGACIQLNDWNNPTTQSWTGSIWSPRTVLTSDATLNTVKNTYTYGEKLYGYIQGGNVTNTWSCVDTPTNQNNCANPANWRLLTSPDTNWQPDIWQVNTWRNRIENTIWFQIMNDLPAGQYTFHTRNGSGSNAVDTTTIATLIASQPRIIFTQDSSLGSQRTTAYNYGESLYGYIQWGDINNTWSCADLPWGNSCANRSNWRKLTIPVNGVADDWQYNNTTKRIEMTRGFYINTNFPSGVYTFYVANGQNGISSTVQATLNSAPKAIYTEPTLTSSRNQYFHWDNLYGYIQWGDPNNTWACMEIPGDFTTCTNRANWARLWSRNNDDWQYNASMQRLELRNFPILNVYPVGQYKSHISHGQNWPDQITTINLNAR